MTIDTISKAELHEITKKAQEAMKIEMGPYYPEELPMGKPQDLDQQIEDAKKRLELAKIEIEIIKQNKINLHEQFPHFFKKGA